MPRKDRGTFAWFKRFGEYFPPSNFWYFFPSFLSAGSLDNLVGLFEWVIFVLSWELPYQKGEIMDKLQVNYLKETISDIHLF